MKSRALQHLVTVVALTVGGCASDGGHHDEGDYMGTFYPASGMYYGHGYYDYYHDYPDYIVTPNPPDRPDYQPGLKPEHPIANPPGSRPDLRPEQPIAKPPMDRASTRPRSTSMSQSRARPPSIPSRARSMGGMRGGMRGGGRGGRR